MSDDFSNLIGQMGQKDPGERQRASEIARAVAQLEVKAEARRLFDLKRLGEPQPFDAGTLSDVLARADEPEARVQSLIPWEGSTLVVAQRKTGKTTLMLNLARCLLTGEPFLGSLAVRPVAPEASVALLNFEVSGAQLARWGRDVGVPPDRLFLVNLRGRNNPLNHPGDRRELAQLLKAQGVESLLVDPFGRAYSGTNQNDAGEVGSWLISLDQFARTEVGALDLVLAAHAGWNGERSRGSSALEDWADSIVNLTRSDATGERFIRAQGRDVDLEEDQLSFDPETRTLTLSGIGSRQQSQRTERINDLADQALAIICATPGLSRNAISEQMGGSGQRTERIAAIESLVSSGRVRMEIGPRNAKLHYPEENPPVPPVPTRSQPVPGTTPPPVPPVLYGTGGGGTGGTGGTDGTGGGES